MRTIKRKFLLQGSLEIPKCLVKNILRAIFADIEVIFILSDFFKVLVAVAIWQLRIFQNCDEKLKFDFYV